MKKLKNTLSESISKGIEKMKNNSRGKDFRPQTDMSGHRINYEDNVSAPHKALKKALFASGMKRLEKKYPEKYSGGEYLRKLKDKKEGYTL